MASMSRPIERVTPMPGETEVTNPWGRRLWCRIDREGGVTDPHPRYLHVNCDVITNPKGYCAACGAPSPTTKEG